MNLKKFFLSFSLGYAVCLLITYFIFQYFSWGFTIGSFSGIALLALILKLKQRSKDGKYT